MDLYKKSLVVAPHKGFEPLTNRLTVYCSTTELMGLVDENGFNEFSLRHYCSQKDKFLTN